MEQHIDLDLVREFCELAERHNLYGLDVSYKEFRLKVNRGGEVAAPAVAPPPPVAAARPAPAAEAPSNLVAVVSPLAGIFYRAVRPGAPPFVEEGDRVDPGQTLCIIEAMKLMNEITAESGGRIHRILVENAQVVEAGQTIIQIAP